jgi:HTH-type transcriptional regulator/antitoxin HigA
MAGFLSEKKPNWTKEQIEAAEKRGYERALDELRDSDWIPSPPGDTISDIMDERGMSRMRLGCLLDLRERGVSSLLDGSLQIDNDMACRLSSVLGSTPDFWEKREQIYRKELVESKNGEHDRAVETTTRKEMAKTISEILDHEWVCSLNEIKYILDCVANGNTDPFKDRPGTGGNPP